MLTETEQALRDAEIERAWAGSFEPQIGFAEAFHSGDYKVCAIIGGNRSGKTYPASRMCFGHHLRDDAQPGSVYWCIAPDSKLSIARQQRDLWETLPRAMFGKQVYNEKNGFDLNNPVVVLEPEGRRIVVRFKSEAQFDMDANSFEAEQVSGIWIDESISERAFNALWPRTIDKAGFLLLSCIPDEAWMHDRFFETKPGSAIYAAKISMQDNPHLPVSEIDRALAEWTEEEAAVRIHGDFRFLSGLVYKEFIREYAPDGHLCKPFAIPDDWPKWRWMDWGNKSPTVCLWATVSPNETIYVYREHYVCEKAVPVHVKMILGMSEGETYTSKPILDRACFKRDQANMGSIGDEFAKSGLPMRPAVRVQTYGEPALVQRVKKRLLRKTATGKPTLQIFDTCENLIWEFRRWKYKLDKNHDPLAADTFEGKHNHALDALKYGIADNPTHAPMQIEYLATLPD